MLHVHAHSLNPFETDITISVIIESHWKYFRFEGLDIHVNKWVWVMVTTN